MAKLMIAEVYDALKEAGASEEKSRAAAEAIAGYENRFQAIERRLDHLSWQMNLVLAGIAFLLTGVGSLMLKALVLG